MSHDVATPDTGVITVCPRCSGAAASNRFYGPCDDCRGELRRRLRSDAREVEREAFVPAMHVTPNAVAQKD